jgi:hypothetical protein
MWFKQYENRKEGEMIAPDLNPELVKYVIDPSVPEDSSYASQVLLPLVLLPVDLTPSTGVMSVLFSCCQLIGTIERMKYTVVVRTKVVPVEHCSHGPKICRASPCCKSPKDIKLNGSTEVITCLGN